MGIRCNTLETMLPTPDVLWEQSGATVESVHIEEGRNEDVPFFNDSRIDTIERSGDPVEIIYRGEHVGSKVHYLVEMTTGIARDVVVYMPLPSKQESMQFTIHMDTPFLTGIDGHNDRIAHAFMQHTDQPVIMVGPENINKHESGLYIAKNLGAVATESSQISLALAAQDSMQIAASIAHDDNEEFKHPNLPSMFIQVGESRAAMIAPGKQPYAEGLDVQNVYFDITDPCIPEHILKRKRNLIALPLFIGGAMADLPPVGVDLLRRGSLLREKGTLPLKSQYVGAAALGTLPALLSGEAGIFPSYLPADMPVHTVNFKRNPLAYHKIWRELYDHTQFAGVNLRGAHLGLAYSSVQRHVIERINRFVAEYNIVGQTLSSMDLTRVHMRDDQRYLGSDESMPKVA